MSAWLRGALEAARATRVTIAFAVIGALFMILPEQSLEVLRDFEGDLVQPAFALLATVLWAIVAWYGARRTLEVRRDRLKAEKRKSRATSWLETWLPRAVGLAAFAILGGGLTKAKEGGGATVVYIIVVIALAWAVSWAMNRGGTPARVLTLALPTASIALAAVWVFLGWQDTNSQYLFLAVLTLAGLTFFWFACWRRTKLDANQWQGSVQGFIRRNILWMTGIASLILAFASAFWAISFGQTLGSAAVVLFWLAAATSIASGLVLFFDFGQPIVLGRPVNWTFRSPFRRFPIFWVILLWGVGLSFVIDNHGVRLVEKTTVSAPAPELAAQLGRLKAACPGKDASAAVRIAPSFRAWLGRLASSKSPLIVRDANGKPTTIPVVFVAAQGGGIRAAYWTGWALAYLDGKVAGGGFFHRHVFVMSGASGGSLGAATFQTTLLNRLVRNRAGTPAPAKRSTLTRQVEDILKRDFLAPTVAKFLFADLPQRVIPFDWPRLDRARTLENAWTDAGKQALNRDGEGFNAFAAPIRAWQPCATAALVPSLMLNGAVVETGHRIIASNLSVSDDDYPFARGVHEFAGRDVTLSTGVLLSSRFPYVTPAGRLTARSGEFKDQALRIVDGGYYENSGANTIADILGRLRTAPARQFRRLKPLRAAAISAPGRLEVDLPDRAGRVHVIPIVIQFINDPVRLEVKPVKPGGAGELMSPVRALFKTREVRGYAESGRLEALAEALRGHYFEVRTRWYIKPLPLGWSMTKQARCELVRQLTRPMDGKEKDAFEALLKGNSKVDVIKRTNLKIARLTDRPRSVEELTASFQLCLIRGVLGGKQPNKDMKMACHVEVNKHGAADMKRFAPDMCPKKK